MLLLPVLLVPGRNVFSSIYRTAISPVLRPGRYRFSRGSIRSTIRNRLDLVAPAGKSFAVNRFGEEYGYWLPPAQEVSIATRSGKTSIAGMF